jgi:predicted phosphodiesterase
MHQQNLFPRMTPKEIPLKAEGFKTLQIKDDKNSISIWDGYGGYNGLTSSFSSYTPASKPRPRRAASWRNHSYWFIGDIHGNFKEYAQLLKNIRKVDPTAITVQVGDLDLDNALDLDFLGPKDFFIQGNHDSHDACKAHPNYLGDFGYKHGIFFVSGASSHGWGHELNNKDLSEAVKLYKEVKPEIIVTHDCPSVIREELFYKHDETRTTNAFQEMWDFHAPHVWAFGHHHWTQQDIQDGTDFLCVGTCTARQMRLSWSQGHTDRVTPSKPVQSSAGKAIGRFLTSLNPFK